MNTRFIVALVISVSTFYFAVQTQSRAVHKSILPNSAKSGFRALVSEYNSQTATFVNSKFTEDFVSAHNSDKKTLAAAIHQLLNDEFVFDSKHVLPDIKAYYDQFKPEGPIIYKLALS